MHGYSPQVAQRLPLLALLILALVGLPAAICGISVGATGVILSNGDISQQRESLAIIWGAAALMVTASEAAICVFGLLVVRPFLAAWSREQNSELSTEVPPVKESAMPRPRMKCEV